MNLVKTQAISFGPKLAEFAQYFGPAWIVMIADVDAASVLTAAENGAVYGYGMIWIFLILIVPLFVIQEAAGRIGVATGKGLGEVVRENFSRRTALLVTLPMAATDFLSYVAEYAGIAIGMSLLGVPPVFALPVVFLIHLMVVYRQKYFTVEKALLVVSIVFVASYVASLLLRGVMNYSPVYIGTNHQFLYFVAADIGAVVMPFMLFYQASATAEKGVRSVWISRTETLLGAVVSEVIMVLIVMVTAGMDSFTSFTLANPEKLSSGLSTVAGTYAPYVFGIGLVAASFLALVVISLAGAWGVAEAAGWGRKRYFWIYLAESIPAVFVPLVFTNLISLALNLMVAFVFVLMAPAIMTGLIASNRKVMGEHTSTGIWKIAYWTCLVGILSFGILALATYS